MAWLINDPEDQIGKTNLGFSANLRMIERIVYVDILIKIRDNNAKFAVEIYYRIVT